MTARGSIHGTYRLDSNCCCDLFRMATESHIQAAKRDYRCTIEANRRKSRDFVDSSSYAILALIGVTAYDIYDRHHTEFGYDPNLAWEDNKPLERVYQPHFTNQTVNVDGKNFIDPVFDNVTLV